MMYEGDKMMQNGSSKCFLKIGPYTIHLVPGAKIYGWHIGNAEANGGVTVAEVIVNPKDISEIGLKNLSSGVFTASREGKIAQIKPNGSSQ
jgi:hypothetical protein